MVQFVDSARIIAASGKGGAGCASFRREKFIEFGGPDGGDGGRGGHVYIQGDHRMTSLQDLRLNPQQKAGTGGGGMGKERSGKSGADLVIKLPLGTLITSSLTGELVAEVLDEEPQILLKGGRGGQGNVHYKTATNRAPRKCQPGEAGEEMEIDLELRVMADVGLVGFPNAGKSTLISSVSAARPKIADYPFTTLVPNLGAVQMADYKNFVIADIPGIIEGAHEGLGLGDRFLKHIRRTQGLALLLDGTAFAAKPPMETYQCLLEELRLFSEDLTQKKRVIVLTKADSLDPELDLDELKAQFKALGEDFFVISAVSKEGLESLLWRLWEMVEAGRLAQFAADQKERQTPKQKIGPKGGEPSGQSPSLEEGQKQLIEEPKDEP
ncbi:MAG: hypothetical protein A2527_04550 [Candidatus Lambdaproteobacteria bacterium RIFOXYD2_FULL_50_16]|uniref:GTPase Obg n=1 Tax=Candidatus Lambdaproteobacteria bacterium RIFOXYD2_FULL_50_16 TaxID=1817772 RepID=A0A1F6GDI6_9PROT|nr:MAG: hypothetical protein A2527_04550 [Candidatus Lambdaproteobacteria bacterium RIFOXYD2_FULL_50_16]